MENDSLVVVCVFEMLCISFLLEVNSLEDNDFGGILKHELMFNDRLSLFEMKLFDIFDFGVIIGEISLKKGENFFCLVLSMLYYYNPNDKNCLFL